MSKDALDGFRAYVHDDPDLARRLRALDADAFGAEVVRLAAQRDLDVTQDDLSAAIAEGRRTWLLRWLR